MAPKAKNVAGSKRSRKDEASSGKQNIWGTNTSISVLLPTKHLIEVTRDRVVLEQFALEVLLWGLITHFLRAQGIDKEACDLTITFHPNLTSKLVDVPRTKVLDTSHGHVLSTQERQGDDSVMARMFGMAELQLRIGGGHVTDDEMETMEERYPLTESAAFLCKTIPAFLDPMDDDKATVDKVMDDEEDDVVDEKANVLMVFDGNDDEA
ncbi:hypothetical protein KY290_024881 [Solanum tuberosum]|uniref:Uncharacterized protein n=1 Tax=Solanum tuberosum TaxID=4113 RepID=A0ABQ7UTY5_SOLTU|nr:hypothetical protein KY290_024881 [Solanum tuberosum]